MTQSYFSQSTVEGGDGSNKGQWNLLSYSGPLDSLLVHVRVADYVGQDLWRQPRLLSLTVNSQIVCQIKGSIAG